MVATVETDLKHVPPPSKVKRFHQHLIAEIVELEGELVAIINSLQVNDTRGFTVQADMNALTAINKTIGQIQRDGYHFLGGAGAPAGLTTGLPVRSSAADSRSPVGARAVATTAARERRDTRSGPARSSTVARSRLGGAARPSSRWASR
jgi:hypothetical protein